MRLSSITVFLVILVVAVGCSSSGTNVVMPDNSNSNPDQALKLGVSEFNPDGTPSAGFGVMGVYSLNLYPEQVSAELTTVRQSALTDTLEVVDITNFLTVGVCTDCAKIMAVALDADGNLVVTIGIKHPFPTGDPLKPITGQNRGDLHVFNIEGIVAAQDTLPVNFAQLGMVTASVDLINASGYTSYLDDVLDAEVFETDADIHPYMLHFNDYSAGNFDPVNPMGFDSVTDPPPSGNLVMPMGSDYDYQDYVFNLSTGDITYTYAIGCTYAVSSASKSQRFSPEYRVPQHLKKAASEVHVIEPIDLLPDNDPLETVMLTVEVVDPSHGVAVGENRNEMFADSSVGSVEIEIPGVLTNTMTQITAISGTGRDPTDPLVFEFTFGNEEMASEGVYPGLVKVLDTYAPGLNENPLLSGQDGIKRVHPIANPLTGIFNIAEFATYATFNIGVEIGFVGNPPEGDITATPAGCAPATVTLDASGSTDFEDDAAIPPIPLNFEFDFDYDGVTFDIDRAMSTDPVAIANYPVKGCYTAAVRVTDSHMMTDIAEIIVPVGDFIPGTPEVDVTDGSVTNIDYIRGVKVNVSDFNWPGYSYTNPKGMARGDGYLYISFYGYASGTNSVFFTRSDDEGTTWSAPVSIHDMPSDGDFGGCSITADDSGRVLIVWTDAYHRDVVLEYSTDHGDTWASNVIRNETFSNSWSALHFRGPDVAIDPTNPDNVIVQFQSWYVGSVGYYYSSSTHTYVYLSTTGHEGTFSEVFWHDQEYRPGYTSNVYVNQIDYAVDGDPYLFVHENGEIFIYRSSDHGLTWPIDAAHHYDCSIGGWHRDGYAALDPTDPDRFYVVRMLRNPWSPNYPVQFFRSTDGITLQQVHYNVNDNTSSGVYRANPVVTVNDAGVVYVGWMSRATGNWEIMMDYSCDNGDSFNTDAIFNTVDSGDDINPNIFPDLCGDGVVVVWEADGFSPSGKLVCRKG